MATKIKVFALIAAFAGLFLSLQTMSAQSGKGLRTVVIDPGHGGHDTGALGMYRSGSEFHEKDIVLAISLLFGEKIAKAYPDVKVMYTRETDVFITRNDRAKIANTNADLFISIHCNGNVDRSATGTSVHILGQNSKNKNNKQDYFEKNQSVAQRRNDLTIIEGDDVKAVPINTDQDSGHISSSLQWKAIYESSLMFAAEVIDKLIKEPLHPRKVVLDQDVFDVLAYTTRPAALIELAFITNEKEYNYLKSDSGQKEIAERLFQAFASYKSWYDLSFDVHIDPVGETKPVVQDNTTQPNVQTGVYYGIQIMSGTSLLTPGCAEFKGYDVHSVKYDTIYKYIIGKYSSKEEAQSQLGSVRQSFPGAFVVKVEN